MHHKMGATTMASSLDTANNNNNNHKINASIPNTRSANKRNNQRRTALPTTLLLLGVALFSALSAHNIAGANAELAENILQNPCANKQTCHLCLRSANCGWCLDDDMNNQQRCLQVTESTRNYCRNLYNPQTELDITSNMELTKSRESISGGGAAGGAAWSGSAQSSGSFSGSSSASSYGGSSGFSSAGKIVQLQPQRVSLKLRLNEEYSLLMNYSQAKDYPIDLYYLMDLSKSMEDDKKKLSTLGDLLSETMRKTTSDFRLGFGSFVDKVLMPYVSTIPKKLEAPCENCKPAYGYLNHMSLSTNTTDFSNQVKAAAVSGNLDAPEGGFDAIMQAITCRSQIGWREQARRLLVFSTDAGFHYAGDGKLGGVIEPNDGKCHLDQMGKYTHSEIQDYPSISQINQKVKQNSINIIFAVTNNQHSVYTKLSEHIEGSSSAVLSEDSANVVDLVEKQYEKISSTIEMKDNATSNVKITYYSSCKGGQVNQTSKCSDLRIGEKVTFTAKIMVTNCPRDRSEWNQVIQIYPVGINESLIIDLQMLCSCECERPGYRGYEAKSEKCHFNGTLMCGICECDDSHFGTNCECSNTEVNLVKSSHTCRADNTTQVDCNGRGTCQCNVCECEKRTNIEELITGKFCECDNFSCERHKQQLCAGPDHGTCECGRCVCKAGWTGSACDCRASNDTCMPPNGGPICSGHGECVCGECKCENTAEGRYSGKHCDKCPTCAGRCQDLKDCVQCQMYQSGPLKEPEDCRINCTTFVPRGVEKVEIDEKKEEQLCVFFDDDDCKFTFKYSEEGNVLRVEAQEKKECPPKVFMLGIVLGVIAAIVLVGLAILLLWKLLTTIHDRREFARFEKERMNAKWDTGENPIYKQATSTFKNPMYAGK